MQVGPGKSAIIFWKGLKKKVLQLFKTSIDIQQDVEHD